MNILKANRGLPCFVLQMFKKEIVIDGRGHLLGRLAQIVAKETLSGTPDAVYVLSLLCASLLFFPRWFIYLRISNLN
jgi:hypothetical protein